MSLLLQIVEKLRKDVPQVQNRVVGVLTLEIGEEHQKLAKPSIIVGPVTENTNLKVSPKQGTDFDIDELIRYRAYAVGIFFDASKGLIGTQAAIEAEATIETVVEALVTWRPDRQFGPTLYDSMRVGEGSGTQGFFILTFIFIEAMNVTCLNEDALFALDELSTKIAIVKKVAYDFDECVKKKFDVVQIGQEDKKDAC